MAMKRLSLLLASSSAASPASPAVLGFPFERIQAKDKAGKPTYLPMMMHLEVETKSSTSYDASAKDGKDAEDAKGRKDSKDANERKDAKNGKNPTPANPTEADSSTGVSILHS
ncbi:hypothetical protein SADUNF_Sadunf13G0115800 [Salix dunnii]|uniref:Uncharacterized protein n=1 Tax=Salix dunnii TaxID=1413687 RepID=A0A835JJK4_9ROSI|nr:hypothetical protein SADUNF_Sadunf13G0115800 [Salix dunnii]